MAKHEQWLAKASGDLYVAEKFLKENDVRAFEIGMYHRQQAAEKALKAFLVFSSIEVLKTHDLERLLLTCENYDASFAVLFASAKHLNPLSVEYRYPADDFDDVQTPTEEELNQAVSAAQEIFNFVVHKIG